MCICYWLSPLDDYTFGVTTYKIQPYLEVENQLGKALAPNESEWFVPGTIQA